MNKNVKINIKSGDLVWIWHKGKAVPAMVLHIRSTNMNYIVNNRTITRIGLLYSDKKITKFLRDVFLTKIECLANQDYF